VSQTPDSTSLTKVAAYRRRLPTSAERVWENVRDWEHLPWLHAGSFESIDCEEEGAWGWRARVGLRGGAGIRLELVIEEGAPRYVSRTLEGPGAGGEIWTTVDARGAEDTRVEVEFWLPDVPPERVAPLGDAYVKLYTRLWDEDESMMLRRAGELAARRAGGRPDPRVPAPVPLGTLAQLKPRLPLLVDFAGERFRVVEHAGGLVAHAVVCPHRLGPLEGAPVEDGRVTCPWHGYAFDVATGRECSGRRMRLPRPPRVEIDRQTGEVRLKAVP